MEPVCALPEGDGVSESRSDVPAAVESGRVLKRPTGTGDDATGPSQELRHVSTGWTDRQGVRHSV